MMSVKIVVMVVVMVVVMMMSVTHGGFSSPPPFLVCPLDTPHLSLLYIPWKYHNHTICCKANKEENVFQLWIYCPGPRPHLLFQTDSISGPIGVICALGNPPTSVASKRTSWQFSKLYILVRNISSELPCTPALMIDKVHRWIARQCEQFLGNNCERGGQWTDHMWKHKSLSLF